MTEEQEKSARSLMRALNKCAKAGLSGGVFDGKFCIWPSDCDPAKNNREYIDFFEAVDSIGKQIFCNMHLDGGAGN